METRDNIAMSVESREGDYGDGRFLDLLRVDGGGVEIERWRLDDPELPWFFAVVHSKVSLWPGSNALPNELNAVVRMTVQRSGARYCLLMSVYDEDEKDRLDLSREVVFWLGQAADRSDEAIRCLRRLCQRDTSSRNLRRLWSSNEGQALLALAERPIWRTSGLVDLISPQDESKIRLQCGDEAISWPELLRFRDLLQDIAQQGRMEHHHLAHAILGSVASVAIEAVVAIKQARGSRLGAVDGQFPELLPSHLPEDVPLHQLSSQLDATIASAEHRWSSLNHHVSNASNPSALEEPDLDAEIARYTELLQQMDTMSMELEGLDFLTTTIRCMQLDSRTPRSSPEITP